jgi:hypothetical protein
MSLELGIQSCNELVMEMAAEMGLDRMGEDDNEDDDDEGDSMEDTAVVALRLLPKRKKTQRC